MQQCVSAQFLVWVWIVFLSAGLESVWIFKFSFTCVETDLRELCIHMQVLAVAERPHEMKQKIHVPTFYPACMK